MLVPVIQAEEHSWNKIPFIVDEHFQNGDLKSGFVLIQNCESVNIELKSQRIKTFKQNFTPTEHEGAYMYRAGMHLIINYYKHCQRHNGPEG